MKNITLQLIIDSLNYSGFKLARLGDIKFGKNLNYLKVRVIIFCMRSLSLITKKLMPPLKESSHD